MPNQENIVLIDGFCVVCNGFANFLLKRDKNKKLFYGTLQSEKGQALLSEYKVPQEVDSIVFITDGKAYIYSTAALKILKHIPGYSWTSMFFILPKFIRDFGYKIIAKYRYKWFGKNEVCMLPDKCMQERFVD